MPPPSTSHDRPKRAVLASRIRRCIASSTFFWEAPIPNPARKHCLRAPFRAQSRGFSRPALVGCDGITPLPHKQNPNKQLVHSWGPEPATPSHFWEEVRRKGTDARFPGSGLVRDLSQEVTTPARYLRRFFQKVSRRRGQRVPGLLDRCGYHFLSGQLSETVARYDWPRWAAGPRSPLPAMSVLRFPGSIIYIFILSFISREAGF